MPMINPSYPLPPLSSGERYPAANKPSLSETGNIPDSRAEKGIRKPTETRPTPGQRLLAQDRLSGQEAIHRDRESQRGETARTEAERNEERFLRSELESREAALLRLGRLATGSYTARSHAGLSPLFHSGSSPLIQGTDFQAKVWHFDRHKSQFMARNHMGELTIDRETHKGRAIEGYIGTFSPARFDLHTEMLLRRENERPLSVTSQHITQLYQMNLRSDDAIHQGLEPVAINDSETRQQSHDSIQFVQATREAREILGERDRAPPHLPVIEGQGPEFSQDSDWFHDPLKSLNRLINISV